MIARRKALMAECAFILVYLGFLAAVVGICWFVWWAFKWILLAFCAWLMFLGLQCVDREIQIIRGSTHD